jgi:ABC-type polysaccharide/polyol phosphate export permease
LDREEPTSGLSSRWLRDIWRTASCSPFLRRRDVAVRYKQSVLGVLWALLRR